MGLVIGRDQLALVLCAGHLVLFDTHGRRWLGMRRSSTIACPWAVRAFAANCIIVVNEKYGAAVGIVLAVHDTAVFLAISYRLVANYAYEDLQIQTRKDWFVALMSGAHLPAFSKALLIDGQMYYMCVF